MGSTRLFILIPSFLFLLLTDRAGAQNLKETDFKTACNKIVECFAKNNLHGVNRFIKSGQGLYVLSRHGLTDEYINLEKMTDEYPLKFEYFDIIEDDLKTYMLKCRRLPVYHCDEQTGGADGWTLRGFFADTVKKYSPVSTVVFSRIKNAEERISRKRLKAIESMERISRKVIFTGKAGNGIIFYLMYVQGKWWLSVIDRITMDCSD